MPKVLLDANLLIARFDPNASTDSTKRQEAQKKLEELLADKNVKLIITPLIRYEVLRGIKWEKSESFNEVKEHLNRITELDITREISELAACLFRFDVARSSEFGKNIEKRKFDVFHFVTAKLYELELASQDEGFIKLEELYKQFIEKTDKTNK